MRPMPEPLDPRRPELWPLPDHAHVPGINGRPDEALMHAIIATAPEVTRDGEANPAFDYGLRLLREGYYFEAHEVLEPVWMNAAPNSRERALVRGVIQLANAALKKRMGMSNAARRLQAIANALFDDAFAGDRKRVMSVSRSELADAIEHKANMHYNA